MSSKMLGNSSKTTTRSTPMSSSVDSVSGVQYGRTASGIQHSANRLLKSRKAHNPKDIRSRKYEGDSIDEWRFNRRISLISQRWAILSHITDQMHRGVWDSTERRRVIIMGLRTDLAPTISKMIGISSRKINARAR